LTQKKISELFGVQRPAITKHLANIFESGELHEDSVSSILEHTADVSVAKNYLNKKEIDELNRMVTMPASSFSCSPLGKKPAFPYCHILKPIAAI